MMPALEFAFELSAGLGPAIDIGQTPSGVRRIVNILGGSFQGPAIRGSIVSGGADWQVLRNDGVTELHAHYVLRTDDGVLIPVKVRGLRHAPGDVLTRIASGEIVDPSLYYFRTAPVFEAPLGGYEWLNRSIFVGVGERRAADLSIKIYRLL